MTRIRKRIDILAVTSTTVLVLILISPVTAYNIEIHTTENGESDSGIHLVEDAFTPLELTKNSMKDPHDIRKPCTNNSGLDAQNAYQSWYTGGALTECKDRIGPGALQLIAGHGFCTMNFIFEDDEGTFYVGTAGHCIGSIGDRVETLGLGEFGTAVFAEHGAGWAPDFGLIAIDADKHQYINPSMCGGFWGHNGPTGVWDGAEVGESTYYFGFTPLTDWSDETRDRSGILVTSEDWKIGHHGVGGPGDSGAPVLGPHGKAAGIHTNTGVGSIFQGHRLGTDVRYAIELAHHAGFTISLVPVDDADGTH